MRERLSIETSHFLSGWKEIASYLGKGVRTVQRYERHMGLPIRRPAGKTSGSVVATREELDAWVKASPIREEFQLSIREPQEHYDSLASNIRRNLDTMASLRDQMNELRAEVRTSIRVLRDSVEILQGGARPTNWAELPHANLSNRRGHFINEDEFDLLTRSGIPRKVS